jgi:hypothetical protein
LGKEGIAMMQWNDLRKLWHSWLRVSMIVMATLIGIACLVAAVVLLVTQDWPTAIAAFVAGTPLVGTSIGHFYSLSNEPEMTLCTSEAEIKRFMHRFISQGTEIHISSYRLSWVRGDQSMQDFLTSEAAKGKQVTILAAGPDAFTTQLGGTGIRVLNYPAGLADPPRFTFLNLGRRGSERIAVAREGLPSHWIDVYDAKHHPQVIALARAYVQDMEARAETQV